MLRCKSHSSHPLLHPLPCSVSFTTLAGDLSDVCSCMRHTQYPTRSTGAPARSDKLRCRHNSAGGGITHRYPTSSWIVNTVEPWTSGRVVKSDEETPQQNARINWTDSAMVAAPREELTGGRGGPFNPDVHCLLRYQDGSTQLSTFAVRVENRGPHSQPSVRAPGSLLVKLCDSPGGGEEWSRVIHGIPHTPNGPTPSRRRFNRRRILAP